MAKSNNATIIAVNGQGVPRPSSHEEFPIPLEGIITVRLDTGRIVEMVIGELSMLYERGEVPSDLKPLVARQLFAPAKESDGEREKRYFERWKVVKWLVGRVTLHKIDVGRLFDDEVWQIYNMANAPALALENFRRQQSGHVGTLSGLEDLGPDAEFAHESATA